MVMHFSTFMLSDFFKNNESLIYTIMWMIIRNVILSKKNNGGTCSVILPYMWKGKINVSWSSQINNCLWGRLTRLEEWKLIFWNYQDIPYLFWNESFLNVCINQKLFDCTLILFYFALCCHLPRWFPMFFSFGYVPFWRYYLIE